MGKEARQNGKNGETIICINPGGEEKWDRVVSAHSSPGSPFIVLNNAFSTTYGLGNQRGYEEAYYVKRISKGWVYRSFPGPWQAMLEKPDGSLEVLESYKQKPELKDVAKLVREESFKVSKKTVKAKVCHCPEMYTSSNRFYFLSQYYSDMPSATIAGLLDLESVCNCWP